MHHHRSTSAAEDRDKIAWERKHAESLGLRICPHPRRWLARPTEDISRPICLAFPRQSGAKQSSCTAASDDDRPPVFTAAFIRHGHSENGLPNKPSRKCILFGLQRLLASLDEDLTFAISRARCELFGQAFAPLRSWRLLNRSPAVAPRTGHSASGSKFRHNLIRI